MHLDRLKKLHKIVDDTFSWPPFWGGPSLPFYSLNTFGGFPLIFGLNFSKFSKISSNTIDCNFATTDPIAKFLDPNLFSSS